MVMSEGALKKRRICLRLDDGTILSTSKKHTSGDSVAVVCLKPVQAWESGHLHEADLLHAQSLLCEVHAKLPDAGPLRSLSTGSKRSIDSVLEVGQAVSGKRSRSTGGAPNGYHDLATAGLESPVSVPPPLAAAPVHHAPPPPPMAVAPSANAGVSSFGLGLLGRLVKMLGKEAYIFSEPVNAKFVPDYYDIIRNPICLNQIRARLQREEYASMASFYEDMYLLLSNCYTYNKIGTGIHILGQRIEKMFNAELRKAGWGSLVRNIKRQPRGTASRGGGHRLDDEDDDDDYRPAPPKRSGSQRAPPPAAKAKSRPGAARPLAKAGGGGVARTKSVNSYKAFQPLPEDKQARLAEALSNEETLETKMEGVVEILQQAGELGASEDGEVELDLTILSPQTVWKLYEFIFGPEQPGADAAQRSGSGFQLEQDSDYDPEEDEED